MISCDISPQVRHERDSALKASESAYEACEMLREQLTLITRERDLATSKVGGVTTGNGRGIAGSRWAKTLAFIRWKSCMS